MCRPIEVLTIGGCGRIGIAHLGTAAFRSSTFQKQVGSHCPAQTKTYGSPSTVRSTTTNKYEPNWNLWAILSAPGPIRRSSSTHIGNGVEIVFRGFAECSLLESGTGRSDSCSSHAIGWVKSHCFIRSSAAGSFLLLNYKVYWRMESCRAK